MKKEFSSKRFLMRPLRMSDYEVWRSAHAASMPKQNEYDQEKKTEKELGRPAFAKFVRQNKKYWRDGVIYYFAVFEKKTGRLMGFVLFALIQRFNVQSARISYALLNNFWKRGYGKEIVASAVLHAFRQLKLHRLEAEILPGNRGSIALVKSLGFQSEGLRRGAVYFNREWHDHLVFALLSEDLGARTAKPTILR